MTAISGRTLLAICQMLARSVGVWKPIAAAFSAWLAPGVRLSEG